jgi:thiamine biosynthesis protein ThiS
LNGEPYDTPGPLSISDLLARLKLDPRRVAVEHNLTVVKRAQYADTIVRERDAIEVVNFVGGGSCRGGRADL